MITAITGWAPSGDTLWFASAVPSSEGNYTLNYGPLTNSPQEFITDNCSLAESAGIGLLVGVDFPIGLPGRFAERAGFASFRSAITTIREQTDSTFLSANDRPSLRRPFSPLPPRRVATALHLGLDDLFRRCDLKTLNRQRATPMFCVQHSSYNGRSAARGWSELLAALHDSFALWPFDGSFGGLLQERPVLVEVFAAEAVAQLAIPLGPGTQHSKRSRTDRAAVAGELLRSATTAGLALKKEQEGAISQGCETEFAFDAIASVVQLLRISVGLRQVAEPDDAVVRGTEGWLIGQPFPEERPLPADRAFLQPVNMKQGPAYYIERVRVDSDEGTTCLDLAYPMETSGVVNVICGLNNSGKSFLLDQIRRLLKGLSHNAAVSLEPLPKGQPRLLFVGKAWAVKDEIGVINIGQTADGLQVPARLGEYRRIGLSFLASQIAPYLDEADRLDLAVRLRDAAVRQRIAERFDLEKTAYRCNQADPLVRRLEQLLQSRLYFRCAKRVSQASSWLFELVLVDGDGTTTPFKEWSDGQRLCFYVLTSLEHFQPDVLLFDEMENHLHPAFISELLEGVRRRRVQAIITTHHPHLIFSRFVDRVFYMEIRRPGPNPDPPVQVDYSKRYVDRGLRRSVARLDDDFDRIATAYKLFSHVDEQLLHQAEFLQTRMTLSLVRALASLFDHPPVREGRKPLPDSQSEQLAAHLRRFAGGARRNQVRLLDLGAGIGRQVAELRKVSAWQLGAEIQWTCFEAIQTNLESLRARFGADERVRIVGSPDELAGESYDLCVISNVLHELTPPGVADFLTLADAHVDHTDGGIVVLELFPLLRPEGFAVPIDAASMQDLLTSAGLLADVTQISLRSETSAYCAFARRQGPPLERSDVVRATEEVWERLALRALSAYAIRTRPNTVADHLRVLSYLTTITSVAAWKNGVWTA